ncbi:hypothetical protein TBLA_0A00510 [Henningerozyma blattae CBS 6284]|uniref:Stress-associated endoplasmic reticulum protein n=1 Tax=Henningerozyma blattae (strain ATCC 34711 / CBS 6284 / DSM 70876 / NBRC 10599 / NRRL Y-10934 / UCD 77-7) TaxID=1071380 RepID=I2GUP9_HENB6|nr:hypothetical protein TBLA_0A00510 [Tetrapisispora blattae CBS 6284]CCH57851.1 hypothetical protein TBLA_0A00510 [Tetrapisispora blattae CBS 6284]
MAIQTPKQRIANQKFNKKIEQSRKLGKKKVKEVDPSSKPALSKSWIYLLAFLIIGGGILELISSFL